MKAATARRRGSPVSPVSGGGGPILLVTFFSIPFAREALQLAVDCAIEESQPLIVANVVELPPLPMAVRLGHDQLDLPEEVDAALREPAQVAASFGVRVERLLVKSPRPVTALVQLVGERRPGLLVLGPAPGRLSGRFVRRAASQVREKTDCLLWLADDGEGGASRR